MFMFPSVFYEVYGFFFLLIHGFLGCCSKLPSSFSLLTAHLSCWVQNCISSFCVVIYISWQLRYVNCIYQLTGKSLQDISIIKGRTAASFMNVMQGKKTSNLRMSSNVTQNFFFPTFLWSVLTMHSLWVFKN
jgi:hypothetical protein